MMMGESSNDECCMCDDVWTDGQMGWLLCDTDGCANTVCPKCTSSLSLLVSDLFYCPTCAGSGNSAAATMGGAIATAVAAIVELEKLPLSFNTTKHILSNLVKYPNEVKYRKLRLENKAVRELVDLEPVLNILTSIGFVRSHCTRQRKSKSVNDKANRLPPTEQVLQLDGPLPASQINELLQIMNSMGPDADLDDDATSKSEDRKNTSKMDNEKRKQSSIASEESVKKTKQDDEQHSE